MQKNTVSLQLAGKRFQVPCAPSDAPDLLLAAQSVDDALAKMPKGQPLELRLLMLSLNLSYDLLQSDRFSKSLEGDIATTLRHVQRMLEEQKGDADAN
jgi:cell division protein ZapA (FtsZ GTPase activity inhibitor)